MLFDCGLFVFMLFYLGWPFLEVLDVILSMPRIHLKVEKFYVGITIFKIPYSFYAFCESV